MGNHLSCWAPGIREDSAHPLLNPASSQLGSAEGSNSRSMASILRLPQCLRIGGQDEVGAAPNGTDEAVATGEKKVILPPENMEELLKHLDNDTLFKCRCVGTYWRAVADSILEQRALCYLSPLLVCPSGSGSPISIRLRGAKALLSFVEGMCHRRIYYAQHLPTGAVHIELKDESEESYSHAYPSIWEMVVDFCSIVGKHLSNFTLEIFCSNRGMGHEGWSLQVSKDLYDLLLQMPRLKGLTMRGVLLRQSMRVIPNPLGRDGWYRHNLLPPIQQLEYLNLLARRRFWSCDMVSAWFLLSYGPQLITLKINDGGLYAYFTHQDTKPLKKLEALHLSTIYNEREQDEDDDWVSPNVLNEAPPWALPALTCLWIRCAYLEFVQMFLYLHKVENLKQLHFHVVYCGEDDPLREEADRPFRQILSKQGSHTHLFTKKWPRNEEFEVKRGVRIAMISLDEQPPLLNLTQLTLPYLYTSGFWRGNGLYKVLAMVPNLKVLHLSQCNDWTVCLCHGCARSDQRFFGENANLVLDKMSKELIATNFAENLFLRMQSLESVHFFPDEDTCPGLAFLMHDKLTCGQIVTKVDTTVPVKQ